MSILFQPESLSPVIREDGLYMAPESLGVILFFDMDELMNQDIIDDAQGSHDNSPAER